MFKTRKSAETYDRVLEAAVELFARQGFEPTTMRQIAKAGRLGLGALYYYFRSKEDIVLAFYRRLNDQLAEQFQGEGSPADQVQQLLKLKLELLAPYRDFLVVVLRVALDPASPLNPLHADSADTLDVSLGLFREVVGQDELARALWLAHLGLLLFWLHDRSPRQRATQKALKLLPGVLELLPLVPADMVEAVFPRPSKARK